MNNLKQNILFLLFLSSSNGVDAFAHPRAGTMSNANLPKKSSFISNGSTVAHYFHSNFNKSNQLKNSLSSILTKVASPSVRNTAIIGSIAIALYNKRRKITSPDPDFSEPLPEGSYGCPLVGNLAFFNNNSSPETGPGDFFRYQSSTVKNPAIFKYMFLSKPIVTISGMKNVKSAFSAEFKTIRSGPVVKNFLKLFGKSSLAFVGDAEKHAYLRRLIGQAMTPNAIENVLPILAKGANEQIDSIQLNSNTIMESIATNFTLDVAWRTILGLDLRDDEIEEFSEKVNEWISGVITTRNLLLPGVRYTKAGKARAYLVRKIEQKMNCLSKNGPDDSTISGMYFAQDEADPTKKMSREEIISNALFLILAGTETAASTLTVAILGLGLNKDVFYRLKEEQDALIGKCKTKELTREMLNEHCPYLDAVIKETMRIKPLAGTGLIRYTDETIIVDGHQIPKGFGIARNCYLTHANDPAVKVDDNSHMDIVRGYRPERWLSDTTKPTEYMPFGYGPRFCLGANLALAEMKVFLALFARRVDDFDLVNMNAKNITWQLSSIIPKPSDGAVITVRSLNSSTKGEL